MIAYKVLNERNESTYRMYRWPFLNDGEIGEWVSIKEAPILCSHGFHGWLTYDIAKQHALGSEKIFEMELVEPVVQDHEKAASSKARLLKRIWGEKERPEYWEEKLKEADTIVKRLEVYHEAERTYGYSNLDGGTYSPVVPCAHPVGWSCGLPTIWHGGLEDRLRLKEKTPSYVYHPVQEILRLVELGFPTA